MFNLLTRVLSYDQPFQKIRLLCFRQYATKEKESKRVIKFDVSCEFLLRRVALCDDRLKL